MDFDEKNIPDLESAYDYELTKSQYKAVMAMSYFLESELNCFSLKGYAGTGKTFLVKGLTRYFLSNEIPFQLMAPTGRAAQVLYSKTGVEASTIHRAIYSMKYIRDSDDNDDIKYYFGLKENPIRNGVFIIDEASMLGEFGADQDIYHFGSGSLFQDLLEYINPVENKIIFIGDPAQLPPVGATFSPSLNAIYLTDKYNLNAKEFELTEVVRQDAVSPILASATLARNALEMEQENYFNLMPDDKKLKIVKSENDFLNSYFAKLVSSETNDSIIIAQTNRLVDKYNIRVRQHLYEKLDVPNHNESILILQNNYAFGEYLYNGDICKILDVEDEIETKNLQMRTEFGFSEFEFKFRDVTLVINNIFGEEMIINCKIIDNLLAGEIESITPQMAAALYYDFRHRNRHLKRKSPLFMQAMADDPYLNAVRCKYGYAITAHKSQGGEWKNVFIDFGAKNKRTLGFNFIKWSYTAITRASDSLVAFNFPKKEVDVYWDYIVENEDNIPIYEELVISSNFVSKATGQIISDISDLAIIKMVEKVLPDGFVIQNVNPKLSLIELEIKFVEDESSSVFSIWKDKSGIPILVQNTKSQNTNLLALIQDICNKKVIIRDIRN